MVADAVAVVGPFLAGARLSAVPAPIVVVVVEVAVERARCVGWLVCLRLSAVGLPFDVDGTRLLEAAPSGTVDALGVVVDAEVRARYIRSDNMLSL